MAFFNFWKSRSSRTVDTPVEKLNIANGLRLEDAGADVLFISRDSQIIYVNKNAEHLFIIDKDGDKKLDGRVANIAFRGQLNQSVIEIFVAFGESDSYQLFTQGMGRQDRLDLTARSLFEYFRVRSAHELFDATEKYATQYMYVFKLYQKAEAYFMVNSQQSAAYLISGNTLKREGVDKLKDEFWGMPS